MKTHEFNLIELTDGPWKGTVRRSEVMTDAEAKRRNSAMSGRVIEWIKQEKAETEKQ